MTTEDSGEGTKTREGEEKSASEREDVLFKSRPRGACWALFSPSHLRTWTDLGTLLAKGGGNWGLGAGAGAKAGKGQASAYRTWGEIDTR